MVTFGQIQDKMLKIIKGDGKTIGTPVLFEPSTRAERVAAERTFICDRFGPEGVQWRRGIHFTLLGPDGLVSNWAIELMDGSRVDLYFDVSSTTD